MKLSKKLPLFALTTLLSGVASAQAAGKIDVDMSGAFHAMTESLISTGEEKSAFVYSVLGATKLSDGKGKEWKFSIDCLGFDEVGASAATVGIGRCSWADADNDKLHVSLSTEGESNHYKINGGTGKWMGATGEIVSNFVYLPAPSADVFLGTDEGKGFLHIPAQTNK